MDRFYGLIGGDLKYLGVYEDIGKAIEENFDDGVYYFREKTLKFFINSLKNLDKVKEEGIYNEDKIKTIKIGYFDGTEKERYGICATDGSVVYLGKYTESQFDELDSTGVIDDICWFMDLNSIEQIIEDAKELLETNKAS